MPTPTGYSRTQIVLHWVVALLLAAQILFEDAIQPELRGVRQGLGRGFGQHIWQRESGVALL